jgi:hypothetical protein
MVFFSISGCQHTETHICSTKSTFPQPRAAKAKQLLIEQLTEGKDKPFESGLLKDKSGNITEIRLFADMVNNDNILIVTEFPAVDTLILACSAKNVNILSVASFDLLGKCKKLRRLVLYGAVDMLTVDMCKSIAAIAQLEELTINFAEIEPQGIDVLKKRNFKVLIMPD